MKKVYSIIMVALALIGVSPALAEEVASPFDPTDTLQLQQMSHAMKIVNTLADYCMLDDTDDKSVTKIYREYFDNRRSLTAKSTLNSNGPNISPTVNTNLCLECGYEPQPSAMWANGWTNGTWRIYCVKPNPNGEFNIFYTPQVIVESPARTPIDWVLRYNTRTQEYTVGSSQVLFLRVNLRDTLEPVDIRVIDGVLWPEVNGVCNGVTFPTNTIPEWDASFGIAQETVAPSLNFGKPFGVIVFGDMDMFGGNVPESVLVWGDASISNTSIASSYETDVCLSRDALIVGGDFKDSVKWIQGNIAFGGERTGGLNYIEPYKQFHCSPIFLNEFGNACPTGGLSQVQCYEQVVAVSKDLASKESNTTITYNDATQIRYFRGTDPAENVFNVNAADWTGTMHVCAPGSSKLVINVYGEDIAPVSPESSIYLRNVEDGEEDAPSTTNVVVNYVDAKTITLQGFNHCGTFLAPYADVDVLGGNIFGQVFIGGDLTIGNVWLSGAYTDYGDVDVAPVETPTDADAAPEAGSDGDIMVNRPDLMIEALEWIAKPTVTGEVMSVTVTVKNVGQVESPATTIAVYSSARDTVLPGTEGDAQATLPALAPNATYTLEFLDLTAAPTQGTNLLRVFADPLNDILEWGEGDNQLTLTYEVDPIKATFAITPLGLAMTWNNFWGQEYSIMGSTDLKTWTPVTGYEEILSARPTSINTVTLPWTTGYKFFKIRVDQR